MLMQALLLRLLCCHQGFASGSIFADIGLLSLKRPTSWWQVLCNAQEGTVPPARERKRGLQLLKQSCCRRLPAAVWLWGLRQPPAQDSCMWIPSRERLLSLLCRRHRRGQPQPKQRRPSDRHRPVRRARRHACIPQHQDFTGAVWRARVRQVGDLLANTATPSNWDCGIDMCVH